MKKKNKTSASRKKKMKMEMEMEKRRSFALRAARSFVDAGLMLAEIYDDALSALTASALISLVTSGVTGSRPCAT